MSTKQHLILLGTHDHYIHSAIFDESNYSLKQTARTKVAEHPSWLTQHPTHKDIIYSNGHVNGKVVAFRLVDDQGNLEVLDEASSGGGGPCHLAVLEDQSGLVIAHYKTGNVTLIPLSPQGRFTASAPSPEQQFNPDYPHQAHPRQEGPHAHQAVMHNGEVLVPDLGSNRVQRLKWDGKWVDVGTIEGFEDGDGPRHCVVHPKGTHLYTLNELSLTLTVHTLPSTGPAEPISRFSTLTQEDRAHVSEMSGAEILLLPPLHPGTPLLLLCSNRDSPSSRADTVALFSVDPDDGAKVSRTVEGLIRGCGRHLRGMDASEDGRFVVVAARDKGGICVFERWSDDGLGVGLVARLEGVDKVVAPLWVRR